MSGDLFCLNEPERCIATCLIRVRNGQIDGRFVDGVTGDRGEWRGAILESE